MVVAIPQHLDSLSIGHFAVQESDSINGTITTILSNTRIAQWEENLAKNEATEILSKWFLSRWKNNQNSYSQCEISLATNQDHIFGDCLVCFFLLSKNIQAKNILFRAVVSTFDKLIKEQQYLISFGTTWLSELAALRYYITAEDNDKKNYYTAWGSISHLLHTKDKNSILYPASDDNSYLMFAQLLNIVNLVLFLEPIIKDDSKQLPTLLFSDESDAGNVPDILQKISFNRYNQDKRLTETDNKNILDKARITILYAQHTLLQKKINDNISKNIHKSFYSIILPILQKYADESIFYSFSNRIADFNSITSNNVKRLIEIKELDTVSAGNFKRKDLYNFTIIHRTKKVTRA